MAEYRYSRIDSVKQYPKLDSSFNLGQVDPSCTIDNLRVCKEDGEYLTTLLVNPHAVDNYYAVLQVLQSNDNTQTYGHIRFGHKTELFSTQENEFTENHFKTTNQFESASLSKQLYDYW